MTNIFDQFAEKQVWKLSLKELMKKLLDESFSQFNERIAYVIQARTGLLTGAQMTLEQLGVSLGVSKERIRQLEKKFQETPIYRTVVKNSFLSLLLLDVMDRAGSLVVSHDSQEACLRRFLAECLNIPQADLANINLQVLATLPSDFTTLESSSWPTDEIEVDAIAARLEAESQAPLIDSDIKLLAGSLVRFRRKHLKTTQRVYLALRHIGRPAHYSEITEIHNSLFPEHLSTERSIYAALDCEEHGVAWIGVRGTFALKEWGYEHPSMHLYEAIAEIVSKRYEETGKPVPFIVIAAEIGKYRKLVKPSSLMLASHCNPSLQRVGKDCFIPKCDNDQIQDEMPPDELDKILQEFQEQSNKKEGKAREP